MGKMNSLTINGKRYNEFNGAGGGGGVSSWNDLTDKPFYVKEEGWEITVDPAGYNDAPDVTTPDGSTFYFVSEMVPSNEELQKCVVTAVSLDPDDQSEVGRQTVALADIWPMYEKQGNITDGYAFLGTGVVIRDAEAAVELSGELCFDRTGVYFAFAPNGDYYVSSLVKPVEVQPLDPMFIPDKVECSELIIRSVGNPYPKRFKIIVDFYGNLSVEEV